MNDAVVVDSHQHFWRRQWLPTRPFSPEQHVLDEDYLPGQLEPELKKAGVDYTVLVQGLPQTTEGNVRLFYLAAGSSSVAGVVAWADLMRPKELLRAVDSLRRHPKFCGIRHIAELEPDDWLARAEVIESLKILAWQGIPYDLCIKPHHLRHVLRIADEAPDLRMVLDHMGKPDIAHGAASDWEREVRELARHPQAYCKFSGFAVEPDRPEASTEKARPFVRRVLDAFGPGRVMFGSDWPVCLLAASYQDIWAMANDLLSDLSGKERRNIFGGNAVRFYGLRLNSENCHDRTKSCREPIAAD